MMHRKSTPLTATAEKRLSSYALATVAGAGALTAAQVAHASILSFTYSNEVLTVAGKNSMSFTLFTGGPTLILGHPFSTYVGATGNALALQGGKYASNLAKGAAISAGKTFTPAVTSQYGGNREIGYRSQNGNVNVGNFINKTGYVGFRFTDPSKSTQTDFGWVQIGENANQGQLTILSAAYDNTGAAIIVGAVPEPTSLGLLAGGTCGMALWRRRAAQRRQAAAALPA